MTPDRVETHMEQLEPPSRLDAEARRQWHAEARRQLLALAAAYEELGHPADEALRAAMNHLRAELRTRPRDTVFPTFRGAARRARALTVRLLPVAAVTLLLLLLAAGVSNEIAGRALERELAAVRAQGRPLSLREAAPPDVPAAENAALVYAEAFAPLAHLEIELPSGGKQDLSPEKDRALSDYLSGQQAPKGASVAVARDLLAETEPAMERARAAAAMPRCRFPVKWEDGAGALLPHLPRMRLLSRLLAAHAIQSIQAGQASEAVADIAAILGMARHLGSEPVLMGQLIEYACLKNGYFALQRVMASTSLTEAQRRQLSAALSGLDVYETFARSLQTERCLGLWVFDIARRDPALLAKVAGPEGGVILPLEAGVWPFRNTLLKLDEIYYLRMMARQSALADQRRPIAPAEWPEVGFGPPWYATVSRIALPALQRAAGKRDEAAARLGLAEWALALEEYRRQTGQYPASAQDPALSPGRQLPSDPFTGRPFQYRRQRDGYLLYSLGANGRDDNGWTSHHSAAGASARPEDDIVWQSGT